MQFRRSTTADARDVSSSRFPSLAVEPEVEAGTRVVPGLSTSLTLGLDPPGNNSHAHVGHAAISPRVCHNRHTVRPRYPVAHIVCSRKNQATTGTRPTPDRIDPFDANATMRIRHETVKFNWWQFMSCPHDAFEANANAA